jgi:hypothetical protein
MATRTPGRRVDRRVATTYGLPGDDVEPDWGGRYVGAMSLSSVPTLLRGLVDDAAIFPPGSASLRDAVAHHAVHRVASYAAAVGPLLLPATGTAELVDVLDADTSTRSEPLRIGLICRPGGDTAVFTDAVASLGSDRRIEVVGAELGWFDGWREAVPDGLPVAVELPRGAGRDHAITDIRAAHRDRMPVLAKFRTGPTPTWAWPDERELADVIRLLAPEVPFKLTGGLHHAIRRRYAVDGVPEENHGLLNVLVATAAALENAPAAEITALLAVTDAPALADLVTAWTPETTAAVRATFISYGCCTVTDPLSELADLGVLPHLTERPA